MPKFLNNPQSILSVWSALEVLSPMTYRYPVKDLARSIKSNLKNLDEGLPWLGDGEKPKKDYRLYYHVVLGAIDMGKAVEALLLKYADDRPEKPMRPGKTLVATAVLDKNGIPVDKGHAVISSFSWGLPKALSQSMEKLADWPKYEQRLNSELFEILYRENQKGKPLPLDQKTLDKAHKWLVESLDIPKNMVVRENIAIKCFEYDKNENPPNPLFLNSFYLNDLNLAKKSLENDEASQNLKKYLGISSSISKHDLLKDPKALEDVLAPKNMPKSCWPAPGHYPLSLLQQAGVNIALNSQGSNETITAINGPPGTGKTTLLRDVVAELVTKRAVKMAEFTDPVSAFTYSKSIKVNGYNMKLYALHEALRGYEIIIASSNNKAVENVSAELPASNAIAPDCDLRFFKSASDKLLGRDSWGMISAVLGNISNRISFKKSFWWDKDVGLFWYFQEANGKAQFVDKEETQKPKIIKNENCPTNRTSALTRWKKAASDFKKVHEKSESALSALEDIRQLALEELKLFEEKEQKFAFLEQVDSNIKSTEKEIKSTSVDIDRTIQEFKNYKEQKGLLKKARPSFWSLIIDRILNQNRFSEWRNAYKNICAEISRAKNKRKDLRRKFSDLNINLSLLEANRHKTHSIYQTACDRHCVCADKLSVHEKRMGLSLISRATENLEHEVKQALPPWYEKASHKLREDVFKEAIHIHKAFIDAAAKPLASNINVLMGIFDGKGQTDDLPIEHLWSSLFLIVPSISTTFASVERMFKELPNESLGWLLVDEAGQALPQAAVGALMRTQHAVVVGDPLQIEPIVTLPQELTEGICKKFGVDPTLYNAPEASTQTLADTATPYVAEFSGLLKSRTVGVPLLVHRRCADPMFSISNAIAYENLMVNKKMTSNTPSIAQVLGKSCWINIDGPSQNKWSINEGRAVLKLLQQLKDENVEPDLYIVTPFVSVQQGLRTLLRDAGVLEGWHPNPNDWLSKNVGTVHTVQGREAEAVIFILGAPSPVETGARSWAGHSPNILNVAVTRAKENIYVVGNKKAWQGTGVFQELSSSML